MPASYPTSSKVFTSRSNGQTIDASHVGDLQLEVTAISQDLLAGLPVARGGSGRTTLTADAILLGNGSSAVQMTAVGDFASIEGVVIAMEVFS